MSISKIVIKDRNGKVKISTDFDVAGMDDGCIAERTRQLKHEYPQNIYLWTIKYGGEGYSTFPCAENDNHIRVYFVDGEANELSFGMADMKAWTVIGFGDLKDALAAVGYDVVKKKRTTIRGARGTGPFSNMGPTVDQIDPDK